MVHWSIITSPASVFAEHRDGKQAIYYDGLISRLVYIIGSLAWRFEEEEDTTATDFGGRFLYGPIRVLVAYEVVTVRRERETYVFEFVWTL